MRHITRVATHCCSDPPLRVATQFVPSRAWRDRVAQYKAKHEQMMDGLFIYKGFEDQTVEVLLLS